ncbi:serine palmitoyltransferase 1-like [Cylas formicarius]|uniref:serine palmitoyltransferase 1-like n=1 Tax=Cylas formicarius TaxID=197179 RepID=UPI0029588DB1|nr:serine palmitoyltransferase 1-like [Cylas formicarius]
MKMDGALLQRRLEQFEPEPLVKRKVTKTKSQIESSAIREDDHNVDLAKTNFLDVLHNEEIKRECEKKIREYGVGTCGPRAFYGTTDIHLDLERRIAEWLGTDESIVYSYGFVAVSSSIAAYCKRSDIVFVDELANESILQGLMAARSKIVRFKHNNPANFRDEVRKIAKKEKEKKPARKFLIAEAVSWETGKILPLPEFLAVTEEYKIRVFLEESYSIGILGETGKGLTEHYGIERSRLDMIICTLEAAIGSIGGFCTGSHMAIEHQRLSGSGYIFSASLPTYLAYACIRSIEMLGDKPKQLVTLARKGHDFLVECGYEVRSDPLCPFKVFAAGTEGRNKTVHEYCKSKGVHFILKGDFMVMNLTVALSDDPIRFQTVKSVLREAIEQA